MSWKKLLYLRQPFPDNYTDSSFLDQLKRNSSVAKYSRSKLVSDFALVAQYASLLLLVNTNFSAIYSSIWPVHVPTVLSSLLTLVILVAGASRPSGRSSLKSAVVISTLLLVVSPVLRSLTSSTSSDSIWALSTCLTGLNVMCHDYCLDTSKKYRSIVSTNLSFANAIVLASRLPASSAVFSFVIFSIEISVLVPLLDVQLRRRSATLHYMLMGTVFVSTAAIVGRVHGLLFAFSYVGGVLFFAVGLPWYFMFLQRYKNELQGPWDVAEPVIRSVS